MRTLFVALLLTATASAGSTLAEARALASDGRDFLALWSDPALHASIILDAGGVARSTRLGTRKTIDAAAAWNGQTYVVAWIEVEGANPYNLTYFAHRARLSAGGELLDVVDAPQTQNGPRSVGIAENGGNTLIAWGSIVLDLIDGDGHVARETSLPHYGASFPHVFADGDGFIAFVLEEDGHGMDAVPPGPWHITAQRIDAGGSAVGDSVFVDDNRYATGDFGIGRSGGTGFTLVRTVESPVLDPSRKTLLSTRRIRGDLLSESPGFVTLPAGFSDTGIICDAVCTAYIQSNRADGGVLTLRSDPTSPGAPVSFLPAGASFPRVASNGRKYLVLWNDGDALKTLDCDSTLQPLPGATPQPVVRPDRRRTMRP